MSTHNDLEKAARDPNYRILYEGEKQQEAMDAVHRRRFPSEDTNKKKKKSKEEEGTVICTELHRQGLLAREDYLLSYRHLRERLTPRHERGYHAWAIAVVRAMRRSKRATAFWSLLAHARADHIAFLYGDAARRNRFGALLCAVGHPVCYVIGGFVSEQDWRALYRSEARSRT